MKRVKQVLVCVDTVNCARDGYKYYKLRRRQYFTENGTNCTSKREEQSN